MAQNSAKGSSYITPSLDNLTDVVLSGSTTNQVLTYNGSQWVNSATQGDMLKSVYDADNDGVVDSAAKEVLHVRNTTGSTIPKASVVYISGATGQLPTITLADADTEATSSKTIGLTLEAIANNSNGDIIVSGLFQDVDTSAFAPVSESESTPSIEPSNPSRRACERCLWIKCVASPLPR